MELCDCNREGVMGTKKHPCNLCALCGRIERIEVHKHRGRGLLESIYEEAFWYPLQKVWYNSS